MDGLAGILSQLQEGKPLAHQESSESEEVDDAPTTDEREELEEELDGTKREREDSDAEDIAKSRKRRQRQPRAVRRRPILAVENKSSAGIGATEAEKEALSEANNANSFALEGKSGDNKKVAKDTSQSKPEVYEPCAVFVNGLPFALKKTEPLKEAFLQFGNIREVHIAFDGKGKSKGVGCILFDNEQSANAAISLTPHPTLMDRQLDVRPCKARFLRAFHRPKITRLPPLGSPTSFKPRTLRKPQ